MTDADKTQAMTEADGGSGDDHTDPSMPLIAGRYRVNLTLGHGSFGTVFRAEDTVLGGMVAVKELRALTRSQLALVRREVTALRWARLPGVVRLLDDGESGGNYFIAMDLLDGRHFPGVAIPCTWDAIRRPAAHLMETLARVHFAGLVHRDLKPGNVLVDAQGRATVVDFGIARPVEADRGKHFEGTAAYAAPEQYAGTTDARSDIYSVGLMIFQALTGVVPHVEKGLLANMLDRRQVPAPPVRSLAPDVPEDVAAVLDSMLATEPDDRPRSFVDVIERLGLLPPLPVLPERFVERALLTELELREIFAGPDLFLHFKEDGARVLYERTGGYVDKVQVELSAWVRTGRAVWDGLIAIDRAGIEALSRGERAQVRVETPALSPLEAELLNWCRAASTRATVDHLALLCGAALPAVQAAVEALAERRLVWRLPGGRLGAELAVDDGVRWDEATRRAALHTLARAGDAANRASLYLRLPADKVPVDELIDAVLERTHAEPSTALTLIIRVLPFVSQSASTRLPELLEALTVAAVSQESVPPLQDALYWIGRLSPEVRALEGLLHAAIAVRTGDSARAIEELNQLRPFSNWYLEVWHRGVWSEVGRVSESDDREILAACARALADAPSWAQGFLRSWEGNIAYREQRYPEAAALHREAARLKVNPLGQVASLINCATALIDALDYAEAEALAVDGEARARAARHPALEAWAHNTFRMARSRHGAAFVPDATLIEAAAVVSPVMAVMYGTIESLIAFRARDFEVARTESRRSADRARVLGFGIHAALAVAVHAAAGGEISDDEVVSCLDFLGSAEPVSLRAQVFGLLRASGHIRAKSAIERTLRSACAGQDWGVRYDVLSIGESFDSTSPVYRAQG